ncbi:hypothetical protein J3R82DRAFT_7495 [Butyriboletus roseoflavus]|nr:hypothetical protein J3R82DRAFT_7495 [Butyriboletus roseoflavus]
MSVPKVSDFREFPAVDVLGYSLDFTTASLADIKTVGAQSCLVMKIHADPGSSSRSSRPSREAAELSSTKPDEDTRKLEVEGVIYDVPKVIGVSSFNSSDGNYVTYKTGTEAATSLKVDASLSVRYLAVAASASASYAVDKSYRREDQFAMNYVDLLAETALSRRLREMEPIGNGSNPVIVQDWKDFFASWGTHVIINSAFGARFQFVS